MSVYLLIPKSGDETKLFASSDIELIKQELQNKYDEYSEIHKYVNGRWEMCMRFYAPLNETLKIFEWI